MQRFANKFCHFLKFHYTKVQAFFMHVLAENTEYLWKCLWEGIGALQSATSPDGLLLVISTSHPNSVCNHCVIDNVCESVCWLFYGLGKICWVLTLCHTVFAKSHTCVVEMSQHWIHQAVCMRVYSIDFVHIAQWNASKSCTSVTSKHMKSNRHFFLKC